MKPTPPQRALRATTAGELPALAQELAQGQEEALRRHGLGGRVKVAPASFDPGVQLVSVELEPGQPIAGFRLHRRSATCKLPLEEAVSLRRTTVERLEWLTGEGVIELAGLWVSEAARGQGLALPLIRLARSMCRAVGAGHVVGLVGDHVVPWAIEAGFHRLPEETPFAYPDLFHLAHLCWLTFPPPPRSSHDLVP